MSSLRRAQPTPYPHQFSTVLNSPVSVSPIIATLTNLLPAKSFICHSYEMCAYKSFVCHSYKNTGGGTKSFPFWESPNSGLTCQPPKRLRRLPNRRQATPNGAYSNHGYGLNHQRSGQLPPHPYLPP